LVITPKTGHMLALRLSPHQYDQERFVVQKKALKLTEKNLFRLGIGPGKSEKTFNYAVHNLYLRVLVENGLVGAVSFFVFLALSLWRGIKKALRLGYHDHLLSAAVTACLIGIACNSLFIDTVHWRHFWFLLALPWLNNTEMGGLIPAPKE